MLSRLCAPGGFESVDLVGEARDRRSPALEIDGSIQVLASESIVIIAFVGASIAGFKNSLWLVVAALAAHGAFDLVHDRLINNPGVPSWWPHFVSRTTS